MFDNIVQWRLLKGSHDFPGPDGGTCINEAAIIAAGFEYKKVTRVADCPPCFSRILASYAIGINDGMPDVFRNELLMPFVTRLSGTADTKEVEADRLKFIVIETTRKIMAHTCRKVLKREDLASQCEAAKTFKDVMNLKAEIKKAAGAAAGAAAAAAAAAGAAAGAGAAADAAALHDAAAAAALHDAAADAATAYAAADAAAALHDAGAAAAYAAAAAAADAVRKEVWQMAANILDGAIKLGKQSAPEDTAVIVQRLEKAKCRVSA